MRPLRFTLLADGTSDRALVPILTWILRQHLPVRAPLELGQLADLGRLRGPRPTGLDARIRLAVEYFPCDLLFVHRDAETRDGYEARYDEITRAVRQANVPVASVAVVPVRMTEAWLLHDEPALRRAADRPSSTDPLVFPSRRQVETVHAKETLFDLLVAAACLTGRRRRQFNPEQRRNRLADLIEDYSPLRHFRSFRALEAEVSRFCADRAAVSES